MKKMNVKVPGFLKNKYILYILLIIAIINVLGYIAMEDYNSLGLFVAVEYCQVILAKICQ